MRTEISAGGVVWNPKLKKLLLIKDFKNNWALPKGWIEKGETEEQAALREVSEETGLKNLKILAPLGEIKFFYTAAEDRSYGLKKGEKVFKTIHYFLMETLDEELKPQWEIKGCEWIVPEKAEGLINYDNTKDIVRKAVKIIKEKFL